MRSKNIRGAFAVATAFLTIVLSTGTGFAQGKGHGGNRGDTKGRQQQTERQKQQSKEQRAERPQADQRQKQQQQRAERPQADQRQKQQQQRAERPQTDQRQEQWRRNAEAQMQSRKYQDRGQFEKQRSQADRSQDRWRAEKRQIDRSGDPDRRNADAPRYRPQVRNDNDGDRWNDRKQVLTNNAWPNNHGYERSREVHARNAHRKALRDERAYLDRNVVESNWFNYRYTQAPDNQYTYYTYQNHQRWNDVLRNVVANTLGANAGYYSNYYSQYPSISYGDPYYLAYNNGSYYSKYPRYQSYAYDPYYNDNSGYGYATQYYGQEYYPANIGGSSVSFNLVISPGGDFGRQMSGQLLTVGYDQGYADGLAASQAGYGDRYYNDPYVYEEALYDPYSYTLGENRRCLSSGYELGYTDALESGRQYDRYQYSSVDLVGVLIESTLSML